MIALTREETINIIRALSRIDGFMFSISDHGAGPIAEELDYPVDLLVKKLEEEGEK